MLKMTINYKNEDGDIVHNAGKHKYWRGSGLQVSHFEPSIFAHGNLLFHFLTTS